MAKKTKKAKSPKKSKGKALLTYVEDSSPKAKLFDSEKELKAFVKQFATKCAKYGADNGYWLDICVSGITGEVTSLDKSYNPFDET